MTRLLMNQFNQTSGCRRHAACGAWEISCYAPWSLGGWGAHLGCRNHALMDLLFHQEWWFAQMSNNAEWTVWESIRIMCKLYFVVTYYILLIHIMHHYGRVAHHHATNGHQSTTTSSSRSEVNTELSQVLFEVTENVRITVFKKTCWAMPMDPSLRPPVRSVGWPRRPRPAASTKI